MIIFHLSFRKLYEFTEFGKADTKLELMSKPKKYSKVKQFVYFMMIEPGNILLSESPTNSQPSYGTNILPHTIGDLLLNFYVVSNLLQNI